MTDPDLELLARIPPPRRTDQAFARSVAAGVQKRRARTFFVMPALAAASAAFALVVAVHPGAVGVSDAGVSATATTPSTLLLASADLARNDAIFDDEDSPFAMPSLDGSSDEELARLDTRLDQALDVALHSNTKQKL
ncbi:MAG TPA: hypothetical protein VGO62_00215 [Myxococcota bacterium]|jgi:hypothetical protein